MAGIDTQARHRGMDKARRRMSAELARPKRRRARLVCFTMAEAIAVAAVLVIALTLQAVPSMTTPEIRLAAASIELTDVPVESIGLAEATEIDREMSLVQQSLDLLEADVMAPAAMDPAIYEMDELEYDLQEMWEQE